MAGKGVGLDAQRIQGGGPIIDGPNEMVIEIMNDAVGSLSKSIDPDGSKYTVNPEDIQIEAEPTGSDSFREATGYGPEGERIPLKERFEGATSGQIKNPTFDKWKESGSQLSGDLVRPVDHGPENTPTRKPSRPLPTSPEGDLFKRAIHTAKLMDPSDRETPTINIRDTKVTQPGQKDAYKDINKRIANAIDPEEEAILRKKRAEIANTENRENTILATQLDKLDAMEIQEDGFAAPSKKFLTTGVVATEHALDELFLGTSNEMETIDEFDVDGVTPRTRTTPDLVNPSDASERVGREIVKWHVAERNAAGNPIDPKMNSQELKDLGGAFLLSYSQANPHLVNAVRTAEGLRFELTQDGADLFDYNRPIRNEAMNNIIDPLDRPSAGGLGGDMAKDRPRHRKTKETSRGKATRDQFDEAIANQNTVAHKVDQRRLRIATVMSLPALFSNIGDPSNWFADMFGIGRVAFDTIQKEKMYVEGMEEGAAFEEAVKILNSKKKNVAEEMTSIFLHKDGPKYMTYAMQPLTGRMMAQQTVFNATRNKIVRMVTRSKTPARIEGRDSRLSRNYKNILALSFGKDHLLEGGRFADLEVNKDKYYGWGQILEQMLNETFPADAINAASSALLGRGNVRPETIAGMKKFQDRLDKDPQLVELRALLKKKGEDAPMAIEALIDFKNYEDNMRAGRPHTTFMTGLVDGKTNGIANQGMMLGNRELAFQVGALRNYEAVEAVDGGDIRDAMARISSKRLDSHIPVFNEADFSGDLMKKEIVKNVLHFLSTAKPINKQISMIFPYGKEIGGMKQEIAKLIPELRAANPELDSEMKYINDDAKIISAVHDNVVYALFEIFGVDTFNTRGVMRSVGYMHAGTDKLFGIDGPAGHRIFFGDKRVKPDTGTRSVVVAELGKRKEGLRLQDSETYTSSAAKKNGEAAGYVRGRSSVIPTQAFDAATVVRTFTGSSWDKIKDKHPSGEPYLSQIYDAYKVDVHSYDVAVEEINRNFLDLTTRDWNFLEEAQREYRKLKDSFLEEMKRNPDGEHTMADGKFDYFYDLLDPQYEVNDYGKMEATHRPLIAFMKAAIPIDPNMDYSGPEPKRRGKPKPDDSPLKQMKAYDAYIKEKAKSVHGELLARFNKHAGGNVGRVSATDFMNGKTAPKLINSRQAYSIFQYLDQSTGLSKRLDELVDTSNSKRAALREEIFRMKRKTGMGVAQFWAH